MYYLLLKAKFIELAERLDLYFDRRLKKEPRAKADLESHKEDLLQSLAQEVYAKCNTDTYRTYDPEVFIMLKAGNVWIDFIRVLDRQTKNISNTPIDRLPENCATIDFLQEFENREMVLMIENQLSTKQVELLHLKAQGYTYKEIEELTNYCSANAAKKEFNRMKKIIKLGFRRP